MRAAERLAQELRAETRPEARAVLELRLAALVAAQGRFEEAQATVQRLREAHDAQASAGLRAWLSLVEGLVQFHRCPDEAARDRLQRAHALAGLAPDSGALGPATAWLAHLHFNQGRLQTCAALVHEALQQARPQDHAVLARLALTLGAAWMTAGDAAQAQAWFERARQQAVHEGNGATLGAVLHDAAVFEVHAQRLAASGLAAHEGVPQASGRTAGPEGPGGDTPHGGGAPAAAVQRARSRLESACHYEDQARLQALPELQALARASLCVLEDDPAQARELLLPLLARLDGAGLQRYDAPARADLLWCDCTLATRRAGPPVQADALAAGVQDVLQRLARTPDLDDRLIVHATLARALDAAGQGGPAQAQRAECHALGARLAASRRQQRELLRLHRLDASHWDTLHGS